MKNDPVPRGTQNDTHVSNEDDGRRIGKNVREQKSVNEQVAAFETSEAQKSEAQKSEAQKGATEAQKAKNKSKKKNTTQDAHTDVSAHESSKTSDKTGGGTSTSRAKNDVKKKKKRNLWPLKAVIISFLLAFAVNAGSELVLEDAQLWLAVVLTLVILALGVIFDMIGTATTSCDVQPFLAMAARKIKGAKTAVKLAKSSDVVSSVCCDIVGDICGIVSGVCAATIATKVIFGNSADFWISVTIYAVISMATISLKALGKGVAVNKANGIVFNVARILSVFSREK